MNKVGRAFAGLLSIALLALPLVVWWQWDRINDYIKLYNYTPPASAVTLAAQDQLTTKARHIFYVNHPQVVTNVKTFRNYCPQSEQTIVLGCYKSDQSGIFIYDIKDKRLQGVEQVTAAHEMLHAAYDRLGSEQRNKIDTLLVNFYNHGLHDKRLKETIEAYKKTEPDDLVNEMHSVFGSEATSLPTELEQYYRQYFIDRSAVTAFADKYQAEFTNRVRKIEQDDERLARLKIQIHDEEDNLTTQLQKLQVDRARLDNLRASGNVAAYNQAVPGFNAEVNSYNSGVSKLQNDIAAYNDLVKARNAIAADLRGLDSALDTRLTAQHIQ